MLDWAHRLTLAAAAKGDFDDSPALRNLIATGLVESTDEGPRLTAAGHEALRASEKTPWERRLLAVMAVALLVFGVAEIFT